MHYTTTVGRLLTVLYWCGILMHLAIGLLTWRSFQLCSTNSDASILILCGCRLLIVWWVQVSGCCDTCEGPAVRLYDSFDTETDPQAIQQLADNLNR